jgi:3-oxoacyl-[acyl-carrier protein] reductase
VSSVAAQTGGVVGAHYASSRAGMLGFTRYCAKYFAAEGITANAIAPAFIDTEMSGSNPHASAALIPAGRFGCAEEVAQVAVMLASNGYINGQTININGGLYLS